MKQRIILLIIIFTSVTLVYSRGQSEESPIDIANELLAQKKYNEAIAVLVAHMSENPETVYEVQPLIDEIRDMRYTTNEAMDELLHVLYEEEDLDKGYKIIEEIEENNPYPDELSKIFLRDAREAATFVINQKNFKKYMDQALIHLNNEEYVEALDNYLLCLNFHEDEFDLLMERYEDTGISPVDLDSIDEDTSVNSYLASLKNSSFKEVNSISENSQRLQEYIKALKLSYSRINKIIDSQDFDLGILKDELRIFSELPSYIDIYENSNEVLQNYNSLFENISTRGLQSKYISYANLTLNGRKDKLEGFLNLSNRLFPVYLQRLIEKSEGIAELNLNEAIKSINYGEFEQARVAIDVGINNFKMLKEISSIWKSFVRIDENLNLSGISFIKNKYHYIEDSLLAIDILNGYKTILDYYSELISGENRVDHEIYRGEIESEILEIEELTTRWEAEEFRVNNRQLVTYVKSPTRIKDMLSELSILSSQLIEKEIFLMDAISKEYYVNIFEKDILEGEVEDVMGEIIYTTYLPTITQETINIYFGINNTDERALRTYNPQVALDNLLLIQDEYDGFVTSLEEYISKFKNEKSYIFANYNFNSRYQAVVNALDMAEKNKTALKKYMDDANEKLTLSRESQIRGFDLYEDAVIAFERERFNEAREFINNGREVSEIAISYSKNPLVIDDLIPALYDLEDRIIKEEARIVIRDVRNLINTGKRLYLEGSFIPASNVFKEAELRWSDANTESHPEIPYWLALIRASLDVESGRYLQITEPLYNVLAGYLNFAEKNYRLAIKQSNKIDKINYLAIADSYLDKVLEVRALNERARFLQLLVLKERDPDTFKIIFNNDFTQYRDSVIRTVDQNNSLSSTQMLNILSSYEEVVRDAYLANPRLSKSIRRAKLERFYKQPSTSGKSQSQINKEKEDIQKGRKTIQDSYLRFKDLLKIAEGEQKRTVARLIAICEVALGFKRLPVDTSNIRESNVIFSRAQNKLETTSERDIEALNLILIDLKAALTLNPGNDLIPVVIDEILVMLGEESNFQLQPQEDKIFREAQKDFINGRYFDARDKIITILRADKKNKNYPKLKELINRVEVKLKEEIVIE